MAAASLAAVARRARPSMWLGRRAWSIGASTSDPLPSAAELREDARLARVCALTYGPASTLEAQLAREGMVLVAEGSNSCTK